MPRASGLAAHLERELGLEAALIKGAGGVFDVRFDGELIFSKKKERRFPAAGEIEGVIGAMIAAGARAPT